MKIDFVICWVDGNDPEWQKEYCKYKGIPYQSDVRFRDWGFLKYWFRSVEKYAPWVNKIHFVTCGQHPEWLNLNHPKLNIVDHVDYIPAQYLPTFNTNTIELNFHRIKGLQEHFVEFNDDTFINAPITPDYYFHDGIPRDATLEHVFSGRGYDPCDKWGINIIEYCSTQALNYHFNRKEVVRGNWRRWFGSYLGPKYLLQALIISYRNEFQHFYTPHNEKAFLKTTYLEAWEKESFLLDSSCTRFRDNTNLSNYFLRYWQLATNRFYPTKLMGKKVLQINEQNIETVINALKNESIKSLCLNDSSSLSENSFEYLSKRIITVFEKKFPQKSSFEL